ncbi:MAG: insulinase family protein [Bacteroidales bacterium]|nr:insulinase family protein [Bacteroidales bacterium]
MKHYLYTILLLLCAATLHAQNRETILSNIEGNSVITLPNGMRIQLVKTSEFQHYTYRLTADVSLVGEGQFTGIKGVVADLTGSELQPNDLIVKKMVSHNNALDSIFEFMSDMVFGGKQNDFHEYKQSKLQMMEGNMEYRIQSMAAQAAGEKVISKETLQALDGKTVESFIKQCFTPDKCILTVVADVDPATVQESAKKYFSKAVKTAPKSAPDARRAESCDIIYSVQVLNSPDAVVAYHSSFPVLKTAKNYAVANLAFQVMFGKRQKDAQRRASMKGESYDYFTRESADGFDIFQDEFYAPLNPGFNFDTASVHAKEQVLAEFDKMILRPEYAAEIASHILLFKLPKNFFSNYRHTVNAVSHNELFDFFNTTIKSGRCVMVVAGDRKKMHCKLYNAARTREVDYVNYDFEVSRKIPKGFGEQNIIDNYLTKTGLDNPPKNLMEDFISTYTFASAGTYECRGRIMRKYPDMFKMDSYVIHAPDTLVIHYAEMFDGEVGVDSTALWGNVHGDSVRNMQLRQKAAFPIEANYGRLNIYAGYVCDYELDSAGYYLLEVRDPFGGHYRDYFSINEGIKERSEVFDRYGNLSTEIFYQYSNQSGYTVPTVITEKSLGLVIETKIFEFNPEVAFTRDAFQPYKEPDIKKKKR